MRFRAHDQTVADDYFAAMQRVEQRLEIGEKKKDEVVKVQPSLSTSEQREKLFQFASQLNQPELGLGDRRNIATQLLLLFDAIGT